MTTVNNSIVHLYEQWANSILCEAGIAVSSLEEFHSGALLTVLVDLLWPQADLQAKLQQQGLSDELTEETTLKCIQAVLDYITSIGIKTSLNKKDIAHGDVKSLLDLLWILILHFTVHSPDKVTHQRTVKWGKKKLLEWCGDILDDLNPDLSLSLAANLCQNKYFTQLISAICDVEEDKDPTTHLKNALTAAEEQIGIAKDILDPVSVVNGQVEEHSLLIYLALLRRKAKLLENLPPQWAHGAGGGGSPGGMQGGWNLPPEAMQAMGLDSGDYVMYAIVEETILPQSYLPEQNYGHFSPKFASEDPRSRPSVQISEIHSSDEEGSVKDEATGKITESETQVKSEAQDESVGSMRVNLSRDSADSGGSAFDEMGRLRRRTGESKTGATPKKRRTVSFNDSVDSQEIMSQSYNNLLLSESGEEEKVMGGDPRNNIFSAPYGSPSIPVSTTYTSVPGGFIVTSTVVVPPGAEGEMFYSHPYAGYYPGNSDQSGQKAPSKTNTTRHSPEVNKVIKNSQSIRDDIDTIVRKNMNAEESQKDHSSSSGHSDSAVRGSDNNASNGSLEPFSLSGPPSDEEQMLMFNTSQSSNEPALEMDLQPIEHPNPRLTDDWMSSTFNNLLETGNENLLQHLARAGGRSGLLQVMEDPNTDPAVAESIRQAITEHVQRQEHALKLLPSDTTDSNKAMPGSEPSRSSMEISTSDDDNMDELLDLLERIGQEGQYMKIELQRSYAREAYLQHNHSMEEDNMQILLQQLTDDIQVLQDENHRMQKQIKDMRDNHRSDKVSISNLMSTIEDLRDTISTLEDQAPIQNVKEAISSSTGTMTERHILTDTLSQTQTSMSQMRDKVQQISPVVLEKGTQILRQVFQRSTLTSTQGLIKTRNAGIQARPMSGRMNVGMQVGASSFRGKHVATQTDELSQTSNKPNSKEQSQILMLKDRISLLEEKLHKSQAENSKLTGRLEDVKESLASTAHSLSDVTQADKENQKLQQNLININQDINSSQKQHVPDKMENGTKTTNESTVNYVRPSSARGSRPQTPKLSSDLRPSRSKSPPQNRPSSPSSEKRSPIKEQSPSPVKTLSPSPSRPQSPSPSRPRSPHSGPPGPGTPQSQSLDVQSLPSEKHQHLQNKEGSQERKLRLGSASGSRKERRGSIHLDSHKSNQVNTPVQESQSSSLSPTRNRTSSSERSPSRLSEDISSKVQRELDKRFPRSKVSSSTTIDTQSKHQSTEVKPLLDAEKVRGMSIEELRKKRLAMLVESYTTRRVSNVLQQEEDPQSINKETETYSQQPVPSSAQRARPVTAATNISDKAESVLSKDTKKTNPPPWASLEKRQEILSASQRRRLPYLPNKDNNDDDKTPIKEAQTDSKGSVSETHEGKISSSKSSPRDSIHSTPPWRPPGPSVPLRPRSAHSDSGISDLSVARPSPQPQPESPRRSTAMTKAPVLPTSQPDTGLKRQRARSTLQRRLKDRLARVAASSKSQARPQTSVSPTRAETQTSHSRLRSSSSSSSSSVSDLIASLNERSHPLRASSPVTVSKVAADGSYISISEIGSPDRKDGAHTTTSSRRQSKTSNLSQNIASSPRSEAKSASPQRPQSQTNSNNNRDNLVKHSSLAASQSDLSRTSSRLRPRLPQERWAEPKLYDNRYTQDGLKAQTEWGEPRQLSPQSSLFHKRSPSPRSQRIQNSLANLTRGYLGASDRLSRSTSDLSGHEDTTLLNDPGNIRPPSPSSSESSSSSDVTFGVQTLPNTAQTSMMSHLASLSMSVTSSTRLPPVSSSGSALNQSFSVIRPPDRPPSRAAVFEEETDYVDSLIKKYTGPS